MNQHGWVDMDVLCDAMRTRYKWANKDKLFSMIESDEKGRYEILGRKIRASTVILWMLILIILKTPFLNSIMVASREEVDILLEKGIRPIKQRYVHLSTSIDKALEVAKIHTDDPVLIRINAEEAQKDG